MPTQDLRTALDCTAETYWRCWFDERFNRRYYVDLLGYRDVQLIEQREEQGKIRRQMRVLPSMGRAPAAVVKALGQPSWIEEGTFRRSEGRMDLTYRTSVLTGQTRIAGQIWCEPRAGGGVWRLARTTVDVRLPVLGRLIERNILQEMEDGAKELASLTVAFAREQGWNDSASGTGPTCTRSNGARG
jgi:hypothetical protein